MTVTEEFLAEARAKHKRVRVLDYLGHEIVLRPPTKAEYTRCKAALHDERKRVTATEDLVRALIVYPDAATVQVLADDYPAMFEVLGDHAIELAGFTKAEIRK